jgi:hypothetical protein
VRTGDLLPAVLGEGQKHNDARGAVVADIVVGGNGSILTQIDSGLENIL